MKNTYFFIGVLTSILFVISLNADVLRKALIFGSNGQDGIYLSEFLLEKSYEVHCVKRQSSTANIGYLSILKQNSEKIIIHECDLNNSADINALIQEVLPDEVYNLAAQSHIQLSFELPEYTADIGALGTLRILSAIKQVIPIKKIKFYQAASSEMYGKVTSFPQDEQTAFCPRSPYGIAKLFAYWTTVSYREVSGVFACNGILFNHESPLRAETFVTRKITKAVVRIKHKLQDVLYLGCLDAKRDWGYAKDYVEAMWLILQHDKPDDYVIATGEAHTVREFVQYAFQEVGITIQWQGSDINEVGIDNATGKILVRVDPAIFRPVEPSFLLGNSSKAQRVLHWKPKTSFRELIALMINEDLKALSQEMIY